MTGQDRPIRLVPTRCKCSHARVTHTRGTGDCWSTACGCAAFRPQEVNR